MNVDELVSTRFEEMCEKYPDNTALIYLGERYSYSQLRDLINRFATALYDLGVRDNDKVLLYIPNCPQWVISYFGIQKIGAVPVPVSPIYTPYEITYLINHSGAETVICQDTNFGYVREVFPKTCLKRAIVSNLVDLLPRWKRTIGTLFDRVPHGSVAKGKEVYFSKDLLHKYPPKPPKVDINPRNQLAYILYTGGTTGLPKGVAGTHTSMVSYVNDLSEIVKGHLQPGKDVFVLVNPLFHIMAQGMFMTLGLNAGCVVVLMPVPQVDAILEAIQRYKGTLFLGVPSLYRMILENDRLDLYNLSSLRYCWSGGDVLPLEVFNRWKTKFDVPIRQVYGATEVGFVTMSLLEREPDPGSIGNVVTSREYIIVDPDTLETVPEGSAGELLVTSEYIIKSYYNNPEETARSFVSIGDKTWYRMGDYVRQDSTGQLFYIDRSADIIKYKGYRISASEIEAVLQDHPTVIGACAVGIPDPKVGERIKAIVVLKEDARGVGSSELIRWCREKLASYKVPDYIEFRDMLPKSKVGKLLRREIRDDERRRITKKEKTPQV